MRRSAATMRLLWLLAALCCLLQACPGQARPQRTAPGPHLHPNAQLSGAAANSMAPLTSEWRDESVRRLSSGPDEGPDEEALSQSPYAWKPLVSESQRSRPRGTRPSGRTSRDQQQQEPQTAEALAEPLPSAAALVSEPVTAPSASASALSSPSGPSSPSSPSSPSAPTAPTGASPIGESLKEVASQLMGATAEEAVKTHVQDRGQDVHDVRTPPIVKMQDLRKPEVPKPVMVSATMATENERDHDADMDDHNGFQGVAEPVVLADEHLAMPQALPQSLPQAMPQHIPQAMPQHMPLRTGPPHPAVAAPMHHQAPHAVQAELKKTVNASASPMTTAEPQPSTTASDRISTWILLSGTHSSATTPSSLKKRPAAAAAVAVPAKEEHPAPSAPAAPAAPPAPAAKIPGTVSVPAHKPQQAARPPPAVRKPAPAQQRVPGRKPAPTTAAAAPTTTTTTTSTTASPSTAAPSTTPKTSEFVKISEAIVSTAASGTIHKEKPAERKPARPVHAAAAPVPAVHTESKQAAKRPIHAQPSQEKDKTKVSSASVPFNTAIAFRRKPVPQHAQALPKPAALKTPAPTTTTTTTTTTTPAPEELTTLPPTFSDLAATTDADIAATTTLPPVTTKKPKRAGSTASKKKKKKNKNKNRRRRPTKKTATPVAAESKIGHEGNATATKVVTGVAVAGVPGGPGQNGISTKIYNYLAREVMPSVSVGIIGLVVTAGLAGLFLYPFGGGIAARRTYDTAPHQRYPGPGGNEHMYYYESYADQQGLQDGSSGKPEEEVLGQVFSGMQQQQERQGQQGAQAGHDTRYAASPAIYGGGDSGPPDAQYPDSYSRYDANGKGGSYRPAAASDSTPTDLRQGTGYSSVSVNGQGQVTGYADPSPGTGAAATAATAPAVQVESKFEPLGTLDALQRTRYDVDAPISADQVDLTYASVAESAPTSSKKKAEESPYVVGSPEAQQGAQGSQSQATRYHGDSDAASHVDITYGSSGTDQDADKDQAYVSDPKPSNRYSVRLSGGSGQMALAYGSHAGSAASGPDQDDVKLDQSGVDLSYGAGLDMDSRYATANGAQPRALKHAEEAGKQTVRRRRRSADVDDDLNNEIDGPVSADKDAADVSTTTTTTTTPASDDVTTTMEPVTTDAVKTDADKELVTDSVTTVVSADSDPLMAFVVSANDISVSSDNDVSTASTGNDVDDLKSNKYSGSADTSSTTTTTTTATSSVAAPGYNSTAPADDALSTLINIFRRVAEFKLRVGMNLLRGTSEAVSRYIGGVTQRMEAAAEHLHHMRSQRSMRTARSHQSTKAEEQQPSAAHPAALRRRARATDRLKAALKKVILKSKINKKEH